MSGRSAYWRDRKNRVRKAAGLPPYAQRPPKDRSATPVTGNSVPEALGVLNQPN